MSEPLSNDVSTESLCTVIETSSNEYLSNKFNKDPIKCVSLESLDTNRISPTSNNLKTNGCLRNSLDESCDTDTTEKSINNATTEEEGDGGLEKKPKTKLKKSVSFDPNDEKIKKFIAGEPIVDQQNPFKSNGYLSTTNGGSSKRKDKKTPPPVPAKRSTLSVRKTVTQQLREREREKEKERERQKNEANNRKSNGIIKSPSDEFVTTEEVLKQSKYVKTYIKNPDPYFVYDPTVLARLKFEELRDLALKKPPKRIVTQNTPQPQPRERLKELKNRQNENKPSKPPITFKKCSKPNYPDLSDLKIKTGTVLEDSLYNPLEVTKNAKKFDERVKKLHISSDDDLDEIEEPLTKSESSDDNNMSGTQQEETGKMPQSENNNGAADPCVSSREPSPPPTGTFTNTIKSKEFQEYLEKKGLTLIPKKIPNGAQPMYGKKSPTSGGTIKQISFKAEPERIQFSSSGGGSDSVDAAGRNKPSVFQRLLANSIFASRRKTTPKEPVPIIKPSYDGNQENGSLKPIKRVVLERQSFHGRPKAGNLLSPAEALELKQQLERSRKSYASGDDISLSISSALANAEHQNGNENLTNSIKSNTIGTPGLRRKELQGKSITKPPRRTLSRERITKYEPPKMVLSERPTNVNNNLYTLAREPASAATAREKNDSSFRRTIDRQSMIPKRTTQPQDRQQIFGRSSSMDRNEILKRNANRGAQSQQPANQQQRSNSVTGETLLAPITTRSGDNVQETTFPVNDGPPITSTPKRGGESGGGNPSTSINTKNISPISSIPKKASQLGVYVDQQEWERLRAIKEQTDRELYYRVMQQQQKLQQQQQQQDQQQENAKFKDQQNIVMSSPSQNPTKSSQNLENIYEHLPGGSQVRLAAGQDGQFTRGSPQRNTFSGVIRSNANRQVKIIDGKPVVAPEARLNNKSGQNSMPRCQSVLGNVTARGYESETPETPVVLRRKADGNQQTTTTRRIGGLLTREEILQKIKEFCRKSLNKTPTNQQPAQLQAIYEKQPTATDLSPVSYVSVETHQRPGSRMYAAPQVPQRMHSLPAPAAGHFVPIAQEIVTDPNTNSPIYAHVVKRGSLQSNQSELYEIPHRTAMVATTAQPTQYIIRREPELKPVYIRPAGTLQRPESAFSPAPTQYILVDGEKLQPAQIITAYPPATELYAQPQYVRPHQLQSMPGAASYGYITVREPISIQPQIIRPRLHDGRSTPLILDRSSQQVSQIYWTPQHQRLQQQAGLLTDQISPRYALKQSSAVMMTSAAGPLQQQQQFQNRATTPLIMQQHQPSQLSPHLQNIPSQQQQQRHYSASPLIRESTPTQQQHHKPQQPQIQELTNNSISNARQSPAFDWESGSEAGEVQRIMEKQQQHDQHKNDLNYIHLDLHKSHQLQQIQQNG